MSGIPDGAGLRSLQVALSAVAGFVDAIAFLALGGFYVAFMSGNSTMLGMESGTANTAELAMTAGVVACFVLGVMAGTLAGAVPDRWRPAVNLALVATLLAAAAGLGLMEMRLTAALVVAAAMGAENTAFNRPGHAGVGLTYMTGTLVRIGQRLAEALGGGAWSAVLPDALLWLGMVAGAALGGLVFLRLGLHGLWIAVAAVLLIAGITTWMGRPHAT